MIELTLTADVPESRQITVTLPPEVPTGRVDLTVKVEPRLPETPGTAPPLPESIIKTSPPKFLREREAFYRLLPELLKTHRGQYVAIHEGEVIESGPDLMEVVTRAYTRVGYVPLYADLVAEHPLPPVRITHFRVVQPGTE